jgi:sialate O-acetylesterase
MVFSPRHPFCLPLVAAMALSVLFPLVVRAQASLVMGSVFSDRMILQRDLPVPVWGRAEPGATVTVSFAGQEKSGLVASDGRWSVRLDPLTASAEPRVLSVEVAGQRREFSDVLVGEVWLCAGQSNMYRPIAGIPGSANSAVAGHEEVLALPENPRLRLYCDDGHPLWSAAGWRRADSGSLALFSAVGYFFAEQIQAELDVPVGLILVSRVGTTIQAWTPREEALRVPVTAKYAALFEANKAEIQAYNRADDPKPELAPELQIARTFATVGGLYNNWMSAVVPFGLRGVLWYQGESNGTWEPTARHYDEMLAGLVAGLRRVWERPELPFFYVQLPVWAGNTSTHWPWIRQAMLRASLTIPGTGMALIPEHGEPNNLHPLEKRPVGERLARLALAQTYGRPRVINGPRAFGAEDAPAGGVRIHFESGGAPLALPGGSWMEIEVAGTDGVFRPATAVLDESSAVLSSGEVSRPAAVRYAWKPGFTPTLFNGAGLPASPFAFVRRTDGTWRAVRGTDDLGTLPPDGLTEWAAPVWSADGFTPDAGMVEAYAVGGSPGPGLRGEVSYFADSPSGAPVWHAIVRTNDPRVSVEVWAAPRVEDFGNPSLLRPLPGRSQGVTQDGVPSGSERRAFVFPPDFADKGFLRLQIAR